MKYAPYGLAALSLLAGLGLAPKPAQAAELPFYVTTRDSHIPCIRLNGPWFRTSGWVKLANVRNAHVYSAEINDFSIIGKWSIEAKKSCNHDLVIQREIFCVYEGRPVQLVVVKNVIQTDGDFPLCRKVIEPYQALAASYLGDEEEPTQSAAASAQATAAATAAAPGASALGGDSFRFKGKAGDTIELVLDRDGAQGSTGELARLSLRAERGATLGQREGAVPLKLKTTLPAAGGYVIEVAEVADGPGGEAFRGHYHLRVDSASDAEILLEPLDSVEP